MVSNPVRYTDHEHDCIAIYKREALAHPLLTAEEEIALGHAIQAGGNGAQAARERLICSNLRLVVNMAARYQYSGLPMEDLIQDGNAGLIKAADRFDPDRGCRFTTYASWWIRQSIQRALSDSARTIRLPAHVAEEIVRMRQIASQMEEHTGQRPSDSDLAEMLGVDVERIRELRRVSRTPFSLDYPVGEEQETAFGEMVADEDALDPDRETMQASMRRVVEDALVCVTAREERILRMRYGLGDQEPMSLEQIGRRFGLSRERIRQIIGAAIDMIQLLHPELADLLRH